jgi:phytoene synthase
MKPTSSFFVAFRVLPAERRRAIEAVYDVCRRADDAVDEAPDPPTARGALERIAAEIDRVFTGAADEANALAEAVARYHLPRRPFDRLLEGVGWDLEGRRYATATELREYCSRVASSVGHLCVRIFGCTDPACDAYADELGVALQWTNILRDVGGDLQRGRVYLPAASLEAHGLSPNDLARRAPDVRARVAALVRDEAAYARRCFAVAERILPAAERRRVLAGRIMGAVYLKLLRRVEHAGAAVLDRRVRVSAAVRAAVALRLVAAEGLRGLAGPHG